MWNAFAGYTDVYGHLPPARLVQRVRLYLAAVNEYEGELYEQQQEELEDIKHKNASNESGGQEGRKISVG